MTGCVGCGRDIPAALMFWHGATGPYHLACRNHARTDSAAPRPLTLDEGDSNMNVDVLVVPGTGFPNGGDGVCETFMHHLDGRFTPRIVSYPATYGGLEMDYADSSKIGHRAVLDAIGESSNPVVLVGYSAGAKVAGDVAAEIGRGEHRSLEVLACALIADPERPEGKGMPGQPDQGGFGIGGQRRVFDIPTWWAAAAGDPITALPAGSLLRPLADLTEFYSIATPAAAYRWGIDLYDRARHGRWQQVWKWFDWAEAARYAWGYTPNGGRHGRAYIEEGHCQALAQVVNEEVSR